MTPPPPETDCCICYGPIGDCDCDPLKGPPYLFMSCKDIGKLIRDARIALGMSVRHLASRAKVHRITLGEVERGKSWPGSCQQNALIVLVQELMRERQEASNMTRQPAMDRAKPPDVTDRHIQFMDRAFAYAESAFDALGCEEREAAWFYNHEVRTILLSLQDKQRLALSPLKS